MSLDLSIVIPTFNGLDWLRENLPSVTEAAQVYREARGAASELIVVDDGSSDRTVEYLEAEFPDVQLVVHPSNKGFAKACNSGFQRAQHPIISLLNNDVRIEKDYFLYTALHFENPEVFGVTPKVFEWDQPIFATGGKVGRFRKGFWSVYFNYDVGPVAAEEWIRELRLLSTYAVGGFATYSKEKLDSLGGFNELLSPFHWEDVDLSYRAWKRGWDVHYEPRSIAHHRTSATIEAHFQKGLVERVSLRNRLLFHWINLHTPSYLVRHLLMLLILVMTRAVVLDFDFHRSLLWAFRQLPEVRRLRRAEKKAALRSDREIYRRLKGFYGSAPIAVYYNRKDVIERHPESQRNTD